MAQFLPEGVLGIAVTGLVAAFMAGMAANVSSFNAVFTYDIWQDYIRPGPPRPLLPGGRPLGHRHRRGHRHPHRLHRLRVLQHLQLPPGAVLLLQRAAVLRVHHRHVLEAGVREAPASGASSSAPLRRSSCTRATSGGTSPSVSDIHESFWGSIFAFAAGAIAMYVASMRGERPSDDEAARRSSTAWRSATWRRASSPSTAIRSSWAMAVLVLSLLGYLYVASL